MIRNTLLLTVAFALLCTFTTPRAFAQPQPGSACTPACGSNETCYKYQSRVTCFTQEEIKSLSKPGTVVTSPGAGPVTTGAGADTGKKVTLENPLKVDSLDGLLRLVLKAAIDIGTIVLILALIWTGFLFVAARGNEEKIRSARTALVWTVIGGLILLGATGIAEVIQSTVKTL